MKNTPFHLYAEDGFEAAYATEKAAMAAAKRASKTRRNIIYSVVKTNSAGFTGGGKGTLYGEFLNGLSYRE
jgi:hypothetical protein